MKKGSVLLMVLVLAVSIFQPVAAAPDQAAPVLWSTEETGGAIPYWSYLGTITNGLTISGTTANVVTNATASNQSYRVDVTVTLQKASNNIYGTYASWSNSATWTCGISKSTTVSSGTYRVQLVVKVYNSSGTLLETVTDYSNTATC